VESNSYIPRSRLDGGFLIDSGICAESSESTTPKQGPPRSSPFLCALRVEVFASISAALGQAGRRGFNGSDGLKLVVAKTFLVTRGEPKEKRFNRDEGDKRDKDKTTHLCLCFHPLHPLHPCSYLVVFVVAMCGGRAVRTLEKKHSFLWVVLNPGCLNSARPSCFIQGS
jgi:hypothetical protein